MNREQMVEKAARAMLEDDLAADRAADDWDHGADRAWLMSNARAVLNAILPQVTTVVELEAFAPDSLVVDSTGLALVAECVVETDFKGGPLTVVWQPEVTK